MNTASNCAIDMTSTKKETAYHEAGHAIICLHFRLPFSFVTIVETDEYNGGCSHPSPMMIECRDARERKQIARGYLISALAGLEAERLTNPTSPDFHADQDNQNAFDLSVDYGLLPKSCQYVGDEMHEKWLNRLRKEARKIVLQNAHKISVLAQALINRPTLTQSEVESLFA